MDKNILDISWSTIFKVFVALVIFYILFQITDIVVMFVFALVISMLFNPAIDYLSRFHIPRVVSVISIYLGVFGLISFLIYLGVPSFTKEIRDFSALIPDYIDKMGPFMQSIGVQAFESTEVLMNAIKDSSEAIANNVFNALIVIFGGLSTTLFVLTMAIFISLEGNGVEKAIAIFSKPDGKERALSIWRKCRNQVSSWFLVRILCGLFIGIGSYIIFSLFNVNYAILFAVIAGVFNFVPFIGPFISAILFFVIISLDSVTKALFVVAAFSVIQIIESSILTPMLSRKFMGVSPVLVLLAIVIGGSLWGVLGAFLAIPLLGIIFEFFKEYMINKHKVE